MYMYSTEYKKGPMWIYFSNFEVYVSFRINLPRSRMHELNDAHFGNALELA